MTETFESKRYAVSVEGEMVEIRDRVCGHVILCASIGAVKELRALLAKVAKAVPPEPETAAPPRPVDYDDVEAERIPF